MAGFSGAEKHVSNTESNFSEPRRMGLYTPRTISLLFFIFMFIDMTRYLIVFTVTATL